MSDKKVKQIEVFKEFIILDSIHDDDLQTKEALSSVNKFDENGNLIYELNNDADGNFIEKYEYEYDENNHIVKKISYMDGDEIAELKTISRNEDGKIQHYELKYFDGSSDIANYTYDEKDNLLKIESKDEDGDISLLHEFEYDEESNIVVEKKTDDFGAEFELNNTYENGKITKEIKQKFREDITTTTNFEYDEEGRISSKKVVADNGLVFENINYEYNDDGKTSKITIIDDEFPQYVYFEYDNKGNQLAQTAKDAKGNLIHKVNRVYEDGILKETNFEIYGPEFRLQSKYKEVNKYTYY